MELGVVDFGSGGVLHAGRLECQPLPPAFSAADPRSLERDQEKSERFPVRSRDGTSS
jgi:hypothetical protein